MYHGSWDHIISQTKQKEPLASVVSFPLSLSPAGDKSR
jgi:hypothetical protein